MSVVDQNSPIGVDRIEVEGRLLELGRRLGPKNFERPGGKRAHATEGAIHQFYPVSILCDSLHERRFSGTAFSYQGKCSATWCVDTVDQLQDLCEQGQELCNDCQDNPGMDGCEDITFEADGGDCTDAEVPSDCTATVGELEKCLKDYVDASFAAIDSMPSCSQVDADTDVSGLGAEPDMPRSCDVVEEKCPDALP